MISTILKYSSKNTKLNYPWVEVNFKFLIIFKVKLYYFRVNSDDLLLKLFIVTIHHNHSVTREKLS